MHAHYMQESKFFCLGSKCTARGHPDSITAIPREMCGRKGHSNCLYSKYDLRCQFSFNYLSIFIQQSPAWRTIDPLVDAIAHRHSLTPQTQFSIFIQLPPAVQTIDPLGDAVAHRHSLTPQTQ